jgi:heme-degrading monooxygenase HmoA
VLVAWNTAVAKDASFSLVFWIRLINFALELQMYLAMNRFRIALGKEDDFVAHWRNRNSYLNEVPGFVSFHLLRGVTDDSCTLFASHSVWESEAAFNDWTRSEAFRKAHAAAGHSPRDFYLGPPQLELFQSVL